MPAGWLNPVGRRSRPYDVYRQSPGKGRERGQLFPPCQGGAGGGHASRGFTLLELLVATAILGIIMMTIYGVLARALYAKNHSEEHADLYASGREAVLKMADELEGSLPPTAGQNIYFVGTPGTESVPTDSVQFAVVVRRQFGAKSRGGRALVSYSLDPMKDAPNLYALRRQEQMLTEAAPAASTDPDDPDAAPDDTPAPSEFAAYLLDQVAGLRFRYLDPMSGDWVDHWDTTEPPPPTELYVPLPGAVEITLFLADANGGTYDFGTIVDLPLFSLPPTPVPGTTLPGSTQPGSTQPGATQPGGMQPGQG